ncbi:PaaI family thioesterase [Mucisphaera calidilacus]|uniref:DUF4442 domain-containing protein n=1 Tax=Mucisphaera calidilacus TaxID=2527982 RepID=A0A518BTK0_9BACT|nr:hypothetical protein [Mucisphaera calidilacus]QDU70302.1 hypothetical protein Pan265_01250 [Mucisphaera calidilacus]
MSEIPANQVQAQAAMRDAEASHEPGWWSRLYERWEARLSRLSTRNRFWQKLLSKFFLPLAYRSGIRFIRGDENSFSAILPFRRFNRNWYNAMAGGALLGNAEVAGGMYVFEKCGADYTVVCKHLEYTFRRPCVGPAVYRITPREDIDAYVATGEEFNITVDLQILQMVTAKEQKERRVGQSVATFHVTPKKQARTRSRKEKARLER